MALADYSTPGDTAQKLHAEYSASRCKWINKNKLDRGGSPPVTTKINSHNSQKRVVDIEKLLNDEEDTKCITSKVSFNNWVQYIHCES